MIKICFCSANHAKLHTYGQFYYLNLKRGVGLGLNEHHLFHGGQENEIIRLS